MNLSNYWMFLTGFVALIILFLMSSFSLRLPFAVFFLLITVSLLYFLFSNEEKKICDKSLANAKIGSRFYDMLPYLLAVMSSLIVSWVGKFDIKIYHDGVFLTFLALPILSLVKVIAGLFLLSVFPGYVVYKIFFGRYRFSWFEKIGLFLVLSYCINGFLGFIMLQTNISHSPEGVLALIWLFVFVMETIGRLSKDSSVKSYSTEHGRICCESLLLLVVSLTLMLGCYSIVLFNGPITEVTSGDVAAYLEYTNSFVHFGHAPTGYVHLYSYLWMGHCFTGLPLMYVYAAIQYLVLLVPTSVYIFMKKLFPKQRKAAAIATLIVTLLLGMTSIPNLTNLIASPKAFNEYINEGAIRSTMNAFTNIGIANTGVIILQASTLDYSLFIFAATFLFSYLSRRGKWRDLLLGVLFLNTALFTHSFFTFFCSVGTILIFSLLQSISKKKLATLVSVIILFFFPFDFFSNHTIGNIFTIFFIVEPRFFSTGVRATAVYTFGLLLLVSLSIYLILLFRKEIACKLRVNPQLNVSKERVQNSSALPLRARIPLVRYLFWAIGLSLVFSSIILCHLNQSNIEITTGWLDPTYIRPWYLFITYWGLHVPIIFGTLPNVFKRCNKSSLKFVWSWAISILGLITLFYLFYIPGLPYTPSSSTTRYLFFMYFPISCLAALGISTLFHSSVKGRLSIRVNVFNHITNFSVDKKKLRDCVLVTFLIFSIAFSFLTYVFAIEYWYPITRWGKISPSEAKALEWMCNDLPENATVVALSQNSYRKLCSIFPGKILPLFLELESGISGIWPRNILMKSQLPEVVLYGLDQLGATHIFIGQEDETLISESHDGRMLVSLLRTFPLDYYFEDVKIYKVPRYPLYEDANYHVVTGMWNFPGSFYRFGYEEEQNPVVICDDDNGTFWRTWYNNAGSYGVTINEEANEKVKGTSSTKMVVGSGSYLDLGVWHDYGGSPADFSGKDFLCLWVYGANTGLNLRVRLRSTSEDYVQWHRTDNSSGWKWLILSLNNPDTSGGSINFSAVDEIHIYYYSINQNFTWYLDRTIVDVGQWVKSEVMEQVNHPEASEILQNGRIPYSIISDTELHALTPNNVYIFPYNRRVPQRLLNNLTRFVSDGAHVIFMDPFFASYNEIGQVYPLKLDIMNFTLMPSISNQLSGVIYDEATVDCPLPLYQIIHFRNQSQLETIASFRLSNGSITPYIVREKVGAGSFTFIDMSPIRDMSLPLRRRVLNLTRRAVFKALPSPIPCKTKLYLPIPHYLFSAFEGTTQELWYNNDLLNNLLFHSDVVVHGNFTVASNQMYLSFNQIQVKEMHIFKPEKVITIRNASLFDLQLLGSGRLSSRESQALIYNNPTGQFNIINITYSNKNSEYAIKLNNARLMFKLNSEVGQEQAHSECNVTINAVTSSFILKVKQPAISVNGVVKGELQGAFICENHFFGPGKLIFQASFTGEFTLNIMYSSGIIFITIQEIKNIIEMKTEVLS